jgi:hypothetical protein
MSELGLGKTSNADCKGNMRRLADGMLQKKGRKARNGHCRGRPGISTDLSDPHGPEGHCCAMRRNKLKYHAYLHSESGPISRWASR